MPATIRPLAEGDRAIWEQMFQSYAEFYKTSVPEGGFDTVWGWIFDPENDFWCAVAENADGDVVAFTQYQLMHRSLGGGHDLLPERPLHPARSAWRRCWPRTDRLCAGIRESAWPAECPLANTGIQLPGPPPL